MKFFLKVWLPVATYAVGAGWAIDTYWKHDTQMKILVLSPLAAVFMAELLWSLFGDQIWNLWHKIARQRALSQIPLLPVHAVEVHLRGNSLPPQIYETYDVSTLQEQLRRVLEEKKLGSFDGNEFGEDGTVLFLSGPDAEALFREIESTLRAYPLCKEGVALIRSGPLGSPERTVTLG